ncbi:winged helix-turn-helix domain-containing protein [Asticcacaulis biprosthecium]|nr:winged helix-turn-helix domain-containing protein [Asticcacaulis biprosthecium]
MQSPLAQQPDCDFGNLRIKPSACEVTWPSGTESLEPQVMRVLLILIGRAGDVVSRDSLIEQAWDGRAISEDAINRVITRLRHVARRSQGFSLTTVRKIGYRLNAVETNILGVAENVPTNRLTTRRRFWMVGAMVLALIMMTGTAYVFYRESSAKTYLVAIQTFESENPASRPSAATLSAHIHHTLSRMRGIRLTKDAPSADFVLSGALEATPEQPDVQLVLMQPATQRQVWSARFAAATFNEPSTQERAVAAAAQYFAVMLGDDSLARTTSLQAPDPVVKSLITSARRTLSQAHEARHNRDWERFAAAMSSVDRQATEALVRDLNSSGALMLKYEVEALPLFPRDGENIEMYEARQRRAESFLTRAVAADPDNPDVLAAAGRDLMMRQKWDESERLLLRAVAIDPNSQDGNLWYAYLLGLMNRCGEGLRYARIAAGLAPDDVWRQLAVPRLLHCSGKHDKAAELYSDLLRRDRGNAFVLRELYLMRLGQRRADSLRELHRLSFDELWNRSPPQDVAMLLDRIAKAADALDGRPKAYLLSLDNDLAETESPTTERAGYGKSQGDQLFALAVEYAHAGNSDRAVTLLRRAVDQGSLYLPWALPSGHTPMPSAVTKSKAYQALWKSSPELTTLVARRRKASGWLPI